MTKLISTKRQNSIKYTKSYKIGLKIMNNIICENLNDVKLKRMNRVKTLEYVNRTIIRIKNDAISIDSSLFFQRVILKVNTDEEL